MYRSVHVRIAEGQIPRVKLHAQKVPPPFGWAYDLNNNNTWLIVVKNVYEWEKKDNTPNTLSMTAEPNPTLTNNTTSPATTPPRLQQQHHDEDRYAASASSQISDGAEASHMSGSWTRVVDVPAMKRHQAPSAPSMSYNAGCTEGH